MSSIAEIREKARLHADDIESVQWFTPAMLAHRWRFHVRTIRDIPASDLPYKEFGTKKLKRRRYRPADVVAYEAGLTAGSSAA